MRIITFMQTEDGDILYQTDDLDKPRYMEYNKFRDFVLNLNRAIEDKTNFIKALDTINTMVKYKVRSGRWEVIPYKIREYGYLELIEEQTKQREKEQEDNSIGGQVKNLFDKISSIVTNQNEKEKQTKIKKIDMRGF